MNIQQVKELLSRTYGFDIAEKTRVREFVYARRVFAKITREFGYTFQEIGDTIGCDHATIIHHVKMFNTVMDVDLKVYDKIKEILNSSKRLRPERNIEGDINPSVYLDRIDELENILLEKNMESFDEEEEPMDDEELENITTLLSIASSWDSETLKTFIETRLLPFDRMNNQ